MASGTKIEWTEATWNPTVGCSVVSPGCTNCYAMRLAGDRLAHLPIYKGLTEPSKAGPVWTGEVRINEKALDLPLRWRRPRMVFVNSMSDLFHEGLADAAIDRVFAIMAEASRHTFQVLTKRPERMREHARRRARPLPNVWLGVSVEDQARAEERIPILCETPTAIRFLSCEPLLAPLDLDLDDIDWVIVGGESGPGARPMHLDWARAIRDQCRAAGVAFFLKQMARRAPIPPDLAVREFHYTKREAV